MSSSQPSVVVAYSGVHQAYQIAMAAEEAGLLDRFLCSFFDAPGKWGRRLSACLGAEALRNRRLDGVLSSKVEEHPWPELRFKLRQKIFGTPGNAWIQAAHQFDRWAARRIPKLHCHAVVCSENCAQQSFRVAAALGKRRIYDCPGHNAERSNAAAQEAARQLRLPFVSIGDTPEVKRRKDDEIALADLVLTYSTFHANGVAERGVSRDKIVIIPLWTDPRFWTPAPEWGGGGRAGSPDSSARLSVMFAGGINLRKGVPFLIEAARRLGPHARLTLVGSLDDDVRGSLAGTESFLQVLAPVSKSELREVYRAHDLLVLPSLGDSFGFVALEAMACGLPVIVTENCGVPVPDPAWRVPIMDSGAIANRLELYAGDRELLAADGRRAVNFARRFTPERYRAEIGRLLRNLANASG